MSKPQFAPAIAQKSDAASICLRRLGVKDLQSVEKHLLGLAPSDRRSRFMGEVSDVVIVDYVRGLDPSDAVLIGAFDAGARLIGLAEAHRTNRSEIVEVSVSVDLTHRRQGVGRSLVMRLLAQLFDTGTAAAEFLFSRYEYGL